MGIFRLFFLSLILFFTTIFVNAQPINSANLTLNHPLNYNPQKIYPHFRNLQTQDTLYVYAVRVQFMPDSDPNTTGDGRFDLSNNYPDSVDAPPHDSLYFLNHLEFLKNYYFKASKGKLIIVYQMMTVARNLPKFMSEYSPVHNEGLRKLGDLFFDTWKSVDSVVSFEGINPDKAAFIIFHAGVGRDIDLLSQGIVQGQLDIPSIYLGLNTLKSIYGDTTRGFYTHDGKIINNSAIVPEQEYRIISTSFGSEFLELGMNGILVASVGSRLGLPDLFNTETGITAIGRFGLMDGQSIFSFSGVFPPEPSAWEKQYLGWINPIVITSNGNYTSRAASLDFQGNSSVYKILISGKEYFLLENRNRDASKNGQKIYFVKNGIQNSLTFMSDQAGFQNGDVWRLSGSITDVEDLDWSLPGLKNDTAYYQGGILIWHIDENVIDANIASNTINNNINHRGVDLEEAKGVQEIGVVINTPFGRFIGDGTYVDYWFNGNHYVPSNIYRNEFGPSTFPNSKSYSNINSRVCLNNFSTIDSSMTFNFEVCSGVKNINNFPRFVGIDTTIMAQPIGIDYSGDGKEEIFINVNKNVFGFHNDGTVLDPNNPSGLLSGINSNSIIGYFTDLSASAGPAPSSMIVCTDSLIGIISVNVTDSSFQHNSGAYFNNGFIISSPSVVYDSDKISTGTMNGFISSVYARPGEIYFTYTDSVTNHRVIYLAKSIDTLNNFINENYKFFALGRVNSGSAVDTVKVTADNKLLLNGQIISGNLGISEIHNAPIMCDINKDGNQEIIFTADDKLFAINRFGVLIDNFPFKVVGINKISGGCSVADLDGDGIYEIIFGTADGRVYAYSADGKILDGFPLLTGKEVKSTPAVINAGGMFGIIAYSTDGYLYGWRTSWQYDSSRILWKNFLADKYHSNSQFSIINAQISGPCLPKEKVYNWPNPVYGNKTNIRYFLNGNASNINIKILDLSGELVTTLIGTVNTGFENEVPWDVSGVQSGIYIGVIELKGGSCTESVSIKIAVVK